MSSPVPLPPELEQYRVVREQIVSAIADVPLSTLRNWRSLPPDKDNGPPWIKMRSGSVRYELQAVLRWIAEGKVAR